MGWGAWEKVFFLMALLALLVTRRFQLVAISVDFLIVVKFLPPSNKPLRTHAKNFQGSHASGTAPSCLVNHEAGTSIFHKHHKSTESITKIIPIRGAHTLSGYGAQRLSPRGRGALRRTTADTTFLKARYEFRNCHHSPFFLTPRLWRSYLRRLSQVGNRRDRSWHLSPL